MLTICLTRNALNFENLTDEMYKQLKEDYELELISNDYEDGYYYEDKPEYLYKLLHKLSYKYDIEII